MKKYYCIIMYMSVDGCRIPPIVGAQEERIYLREQPPEWLRLFELAEAHVDQGLPLSEQVVAAGVLLDEALNMPVEESERARFYSAGLLTCLVAQELVLPGRKDELAQAASTKLVAEHQGFLDKNGLALGPGLYAAECVPSRATTLKGQPAETYILDFLRPEVTERYAQLSLAERLVAETLFTAVVVKKTEILPSYGGPTDRTGQIDCIVKHGHALERTLGNVFGGANLLLRSTFMLQGAGLGEVDVLALPLARLSTIDELAAAVPSLIAKQAATLRVDQLHRLWRYRRLVNGVLQLFGVPRPAGPLPPPNEAGSGQVYLHEEALICPAMEARATNADDKVEALVPMVVPLLVDTISRAQNILLAEGR